MIYIPIFKKSAFLISDIFIPSVGMEGVDRDDSSNEYGNVELTHDPFDHYAGLSHFF